MEIDQLTKLKDKGNEAFKKKDYSEALDIYMQALSLDSGNPALHSNIAAACLSLHQYEEAVKHATIALSKDPGYVKALYRRATAFESMNKFTDAMADLQRLLQVSRTFTNFHLS